MIRGRLRDTLVVVAVAMVLGSPWTSGGVGNAGDHLAVRASTGGPIPVVRDDQRVWHVVRFEPGGEVELGLTIAQRGLLPVRVFDARVTRLGLPETCGLVIDEVELARGGERVALGAGGDPATLARGEVAELRLVGRFTGERDCLPRAMPVSRGAAYLDITVAGMPRQQRIPLPEVLTWSTDPDASAARLARSPTAPRVGTAA